ncbi:SusC/RagA family TonB-linked outer membrane protein [Aquimarina algiphila]|uniref:TonB-dependent receptor n=1 Tax=Aquimarina algiphila TaxID=2047982 RepID=A0A554VQF2_9FLAO|nr:TonB-dependent receptor [Aquimarina algiphila]TSE10767.1 TonB-dependent receptor [Aquimarina algiphila]
MKFNLLANCKHKSYTVLFLLAMSFGVMQAQSITVSGTVTEGGNPLLGVNVIVKGTQNGTVTDFDGLYEVTANVGEILVFSSVGFNSKEVTIGNESTIDVSLTANVSELDEVIVVGYQAQSKREISGSISSVKSEVLERQAVGNFAEALQGQLAGVNVQAQSGAPGSRVNIQIRGANSLSSNGTSDLDPNGGIANPGNNSLGPLYIIDGVPFSDNPNISPNEIESIEVLKDAATAAIYGSRASGGVIIITTKKAKPGNLNVNFSTWTSINRITSSLPTLTGSEFIALNRQFTQNSGLPFEVVGVLAVNPNALENNTDWQEEILNDNAVTRNFNVRLSGGSDVANFSLVADHLNQDGVYKKSDFRRTNLRMNSNFKKGRFKLFSSFFLSRSDSNREPWAILYDAIRAPATEAGPESLAEGNSLTGNADQFNIFGNILQKLQETSTNESNAAGGTLQFSYELADGLNARFNLSGNRTTTRAIFFEPAFRFVDEDTGELIPNRALEAISSLQETTTTFQQTSVEGILDYKKRFGDHNLSLLAGYTLENRLWATTRTRVNEFITNELPTIDQAIDRENITVSGQDTPSSIIGILGTVGYDYKGKYLIRGNIRSDGSSKFEPENRFEPFWGVSVAWSVAREEFFKNISAFSFINDLKLRASHGEVGNQNIGDFQTVPLITNNLNVPIGDGIANGLNQTRIFNRDLRWETSISDNYGIDLSLFNNKFTFTGEYYTVRKEDLLFNVVLPASAGAEGQNNQPPTVATNIGELTNEGFEVTIGYKNRDHALKWGINGTFTTNRNEVTRLNGSTSQIDGGQITPGAGNFTTLPVNFAREGFQAGAFFLVPTDGIIRSQEELDEYQLLGGTIPQGAQIGDARLVDANGDGSIDFDNDRVFQGNNTPDFEVGLNFNLDYKNFDFNMSWFGSYGSKILNGPKALAYNQQNHRDLLFAYTPNNPTSNIPINREGANDVSYSPITDIFLEDGDYIRLRNVQLGYSLPKDVLSKIGVSKLRVYLGASNLLTITDYTGYDPEVGGDGLFSRGIDRGLTPITASGRIGVEVGF